MYPNVKYELYELEKLIIPEVGKATDPRAMDNIDAEIERIKQTFIHEVFSFEDERHLERYIQYHQQALIRLMDKSAGLLYNADATDPSQRSLHSDYYQGLENLLRFIERHFTRYFDQDAKAPEGYIILARKEAKVQVKRLRRGLATVKADPALIDLLLYAIRKIIDKNSPQLTYRRVMYTSEIQKEVTRIIQKRASQDVDEELRQALYYLNFNSIKTFAYHAQYFQGLVKDQDSRAEKIEKLSFTLKKINQAQVKPGAWYSQEAPSLKEQLCSYLTEEIEYLEKLQHLTVGPGIKPTDVLLQGFKLKIDISVSQLAQLVKVFVETQVIQNKNLTELLRFFARFVITKRAESISYDSLRAKYYNVEASTKESVKNTLALMIRHLDKN